MPRSRGGLAHKWCNRRRSLSIGRTPEPAQPNATRILNAKLTIKLFRYCSPVAAGISGGSGLRDRLLPNFIFFSCAALVQTNQAPRPSRQLSHPPRQLHPARAADCCSRKSKISIVRRAKSWQIPKSPARDPKLLSSPGSALTRPYPSSGFQRAILPRNRKCRNIIRAPRLRSVPAQKLNDRARRHQIVS